MVAHGYAVGVIVLQNPPSECLGYFSLYVGIQTMLYVEVFSAILVIEIVKDKG